MIIECLEAAVPALLVGWALGRRGKRGTQEPPEPRCTGYVMRMTYYNGTKKDREGHGVLTDCKSLRSPTCMDGRCTYHCGDNCKCDASNEPEFTGRRKRP